MKQGAIFAGLAVAALPWIGTSDVSAHPGLHHDWQQTQRQLEAQPFNPDIRIRRAQLARLQGQMLTSYYEARWARALAPSAPDPSRGMGLAALGLGLDKEAQRHLQAYFAAGGEAFDARVALAKLNWRSGLQAKALAQLELALEGKPDVEAGLLRARWQQSRGQAETAAAGLRALLPKLSGALLIRRELVAVERDRGQGEAALAEVDRALKFAPKDVDWQLERARILQSLRRPREAQQSLRVALASVNYAITRRPTALRLSQRAEVRLALGDRRGASDDIIEALRKSPSFKKAQTMASALNLPAAPKETLP